ncbi:MAG: tRNA ((7)-)-methyltransferase [Clostridiales bacterium]|jgi:tRNA (guanine-N7-)-methyltransferase|nr:tRNA ((7)-)-methyltransferase [Clostridiales bacterium]
MRIRKLAWSRPTLEACSFFIKIPTEYMGKWHEIFEKRQEIWLELGCGKGGFISKLASSNPDKNFIAVDIKDEILVRAKEKIENEYTKANLTTNNIALLSHEIILIHKMLNDKDVVKRIFINFCNPWSRNTLKKRRLTYPAQLNKYKTFLSPGGQIWFKTDDLPLFTDSISYFKKCGFEIVYLTYDLHGSSFEQNIETEHEKLFSSQGIKINFLIAEKSL